MPGLVTMKPALKPRSSNSKAVARAKEEKGLGALLSQVRVSPAKKGRRPTDLQALGVLTRSNLAMKLRMKLLGEGDLETNGNEDELSGHEHGPSSVCLAAMVDEFLEDEINDRKCNWSRFNYDDGLPWSTSSAKDSKSSIREELSAVLHSNFDNIPEKILLGEVKNAVAAVKVGSYMGDGVTAFLRRHVMRHLRRTGYNAGTCKSKWDHSGGFPGGDYEYIDVVSEGPTGRCERIVIDVDFKAQFEIARPTALYDALVQALPPIFVGRVDQLQWIVNAMSEAVQSSLKKRGMYLPPWRKPEYMRAKWFSSHKRTTIVSWDKSSDDSASDVSLIAVGSEQSLDTVTEPKKVESKPDVKELNIITDNKCVPGGSSQDAASASVGSIDNNDWHLPILKAKKSQGLGQAGLASLFKEASINSSLRNGSERKELVMAA